MVPGHNWPKCGQWSSVNGSILGGPGRRPCKPWCRLQSGIAKIQDLLRLPSSGLSRRFGTGFSDYLQCLIGVKADPQKIINPNTKFSSTINFLFDVTNLNSLVFPIKRLLIELRDFLSARQLCINHFTWHLSHRNSSEDSNSSIDSRRISISLASPINEYKAFYDFNNGGDSGTGHVLNPFTNAPYAPQLVKRADYTRVLAEFWADGPDSETPPGHWFTLLRY